MGMTEVELGASIDLVGCLLCKGMLVGGPQVGTAAGGSEQGTARVDADRKGPVPGATGVATLRRDVGGWRSADDKEGPSRPEPD
jgi:hypothetical protein